MESKNVLPTFLFSLRIRASGGGESRASSPSLRPGQRAWMRYFYHRSIALALLSWGLADPRSVPRVEWSGPCTSEVALVGAHCRLCLMFCLQAPPFVKGWCPWRGREAAASQDSGQHTLCPAARGRFHVLGTRQLSRRDGGSDGDRLLLRQWRHLQRHTEQDCNRCGSSSNHTSTLEYAGRARNASSEAVRRNPTLPVHALLQARSARHGRSTSHSPRRTRWAACRPSTRRSR